MRSVFSQCSQIPPVTLLPASQAAERFICNECQLPLNPRKLKMHPEASPRPPHYHPPSYMEFCVPVGLVVVEQVQYLSPSKPCLRRSVLEWEYIYIHLWRQNKSESICLKYTSFFISPHRASGEAKAPWVNCSHPSERVEGSVMELAKWRWNGSHSQPVRLLACPTAAETPSLGSIFQNRVMTSGEEH